MLVGEGGGDEELDVAEADVAGQLAVFRRGVRVHPHDASLNDRGHQRVGERDRITEVAIDESRGHPASNGFAHLAYAGIDP